MSTEPQSAFVAPATGLAERMRSPGLRWRALPTLALAALLLAPAPAGAQTRPNVLLVIADDLGVDKVSAYGEHPDPGNTPTLDTLAGQGLLFRNAWAHDVCSSTRAGLLTGRYPARTGVGTWIDVGAEPFALAIDEVSLADTLGAAGYRRAAVGKWHLSSLAWNGDALHHPLDLGFEHHWGPLANLPVVDGPEAWVDHDKLTDGVLGHSHVYATTEQVDDALTLIEGFGDDPWFVWLAFNATHKPFHVPPAELHGFDLFGPPEPPAANGHHAPGAGSLAGGPAPGLPAWASAPAPPPTAVPPAGPAWGPVPLPVAGNEPLYLKAMAQALDTELGRLLASLDPAVLARTYVIVLGDNGTEGVAIEAPWDPTHGKSTIFEGGINVPLVITGPGVAAGMQCDALVHCTDLFATIAELTGADGSSGLDSLSLVPYLAQPDLPPLRPWVATERFSPNGPGPWTFREQAVRDGRFKLVRRHVGGVWVKDLLYDLLADGFETTDLLAAQPPSQEALDAHAQLAAILDTLP